MPVVLREGPYRFYFLSGDGDEPPHVHVRRDNNFAKIWISPLRLQSSGNFSIREARRIYRIVEQNQGRFLEEWNAHFNR